MDQWRHLERRNSRVLVDKGRKVVDFIVDHDVDVVLGGVFGHILEGQFGRGSHFVLRCSSGTKFVKLVESVAVVCLLEHSNVEMAAMGEIWY